MEGDDTVVMSTDGTGTGGTAMPNAESEAGKSDLAEKLHQYRERVRLSQRELSRLSGVSWTMIQILERGHRQGKTVQASPHTLRQLAHGIAYDPMRERVDDAREREVYQEFMQAAGYVDGGTNPPLASTPAEVSRMLMTMFQPPINEALSQLVIQVSEMSPEDQAFANRSIRILLDGVQRRA